MEGYVHTFHYHCTEELQDQLHGLAKNTEIVIRGCAPYVEMTPPVICNIDYEARRE